MALAKPTSTGSEIDTEDGNATLAKPVKSTILGVIWGTISSPLTAKISAHEKADPRLEIGGPQTLEMWPVVARDPF
jgi:hypothetical protein